MVDLHLHTTASDGTDTPRQLVNRAWERGISIISVTDHDTVGGLEEARAALPLGMTLIDGVEFSCVTSGEDSFRCHILGYGIDPGCDAITYAIKRGIDKRREKLLARLDYLKSGFGICFSPDEEEGLFSANSTGKLHIARLLIKKGHAASVSEAIEKYLGIRLPDDRIDASLAIDAIIASGGIPVYAHPIGGEREKRLDAQELFRRARELRALGVRGLEAYYSRYTARDRAPILEAASELGMLVSGGSDYHGENKTVPLGCLSADGEMVDSSLLTALPLLLGD